MLLARPMQRKAAMRAHRAWIWGVIASLVPAAAWAQDFPPEVQLEPETEGIEPSDSTSIDLQNLVITAAKGITTVQEAPAIVTIITADDLRTWGHRWLEDVVADVPGWSRYPAE